MQNVYIVRHCQAEGQSAEAPLTSVGVQQANELAEFLADRKIDSIISSPFERARRTILPLADKLGLDVVLDDRLSERILSGKNQSEWREMLRRTYGDLDLCYEGGESSREAMSRAIRVVMEILDRGYTNTVIVSHGNLISLLLKHFDDRVGYKEWEALSNPDVYQITFEGGNFSVGRIWAD